MTKTLRDLRRFLKANPHFGISVPAVLCFVQFIYEAAEIMQTGKFDDIMLNRLLSSVNGFEAVCLFVIMLVLKN